MSFNPELLLLFDNPAPEVVAAAKEAIIKDPEKIKDWDGGILAYYPNDNAVHAIAFKENPFSILHVQNPDEKFLEDVFLLAADAFKGIFTSEPDDITFEEDEVRFVLAYFEKRMPLSVIALVKELPRLVPFVSDKSILIPDVVPKAKSSDFLSIDNIEDQIVLPVKDLEL
ncbi:MAG: hypothetical protein ACTSXQ_03120 [Alphaproteobacteria bacterium]